VAVYWAGPGIATTKSGSTFQEPQDSESAPFRFFAVLWLDLLGQKDSLRRAVNFVPDDGSGQATFDDISREASRVFIWRNKIKQIANQLTGSPIDFQLQTLEPDEVVSAMEMTSIVTAAPISINYLGDATMLYVPLAYGNGQNPYAVVSLIAAASRIMLMSLQEGRPIRGALDVGLGTDNSANSLYGPILLNVYELETNHAQWPRIVVGSNLNKYFAACEGLASSTSSVERLVSKMVLSGRSLLCNDPTDGYDCIDYAGKLAKSMFPNVEHIDAAVNDALDFCTQSKNRFLSEKNILLADRYDNVIRYLTSRMFPQT